MKIELAAQRKPRRLNVFDAFQGNRSAGQVEPDFLPGERVTQIAGDDPRTVRHAVVRREGAELGVVKAEFVLAEDNLSAEAVERQAPGFSFGDIEQAVEFWRSACAPAVELSREQSVHRVGSVE